MKNQLIALMVSFAGINLAAGQTPPDETPPWANKLFGPPTNLVHDFGIVPRGVILSHQFVVTNIYSEPLRIDSVRVSTSPIYARADQSLLQPDEKTRVTVDMDSKRFVGQRSNSIYVYVTTGPYASEARLTVTAKSRADISCIPGEAWFGSVSPGASPVETIIIERDGQRDWQIKELIVPKDAAFHAVIKRLEPKEETVRDQVTVTLRKDLELGRFVERLVVKTNDPTLPEFPLLVRGKIEWPIEAVPAVIQLNDVQPNVILTRSFMIRSANLFKVRYVFGSDAVRLGSPPLPKEPKNIALEITTPKQPGPFRYRVEIMTDAHDYPLHVMIEGVVKNR